MTLGQKLAAYRKLAGFTQQQLGEQLNISAQAVSKWEKDQAEPDLATVRLLAGIYKISVDSLLNLDESPTLPKEHEEKDDEEEEKNKPTLPIGYCKSCGISVTKENLGATSPLILCRKCHTAKEIAADKAAAQARRDAEAKVQKEKYERDQNSAACKRRFIWSTVVGSIVAIAFLIFMINVLTASFSSLGLFITIVGTYAVFALVNCLFYECIVREVILDWSFKTFQFPGLIFTFDLDGCMWFIGMQLLFWVIGFLLSLFVFCIGVTIGLACAVFVYPYVMIRLRNDYLSGVHSYLL